MKRADDAQSEIHQSIKKEAAPIKRLRPTEITLSTQNDERVRLPASVAFLSQVIKEKFEKEDSSSIVLDIPFEHLDLIAQCLRCFTFLTFWKQKICFRNMATDQLITLVHPLLAASENFDFMTHCFALKIDCLLHFVAHYYVIVLPTLAIQEFNKESPKYISLEEKLSRYPACDYIRQLFASYQQNQKNIAAFDRHRSHCQLSALANEKPHTELKLIDILDDSMSLPSLVESLCMNDFLDIEPLTQTFAQLIVKRLASTNHTVDAIPVSPLFGPLSEPLKLIIAEQVAIKQKQVG